MLNVGVNHPDSKEGVKASMYAYVPFFVYTYTVYVSCEYVCM